MAPPLEGRDPQSAHLLRQDTSAAQFLRAIQGYRFSTMTWAEQSPASAPVTFALEVATGAVGVRDPAEVLGMFQSVRHMTIYAGTGIGCRQLDRSKSM